MRVSPLVWVKNIGQRLKQYWWLWFTGSACAVFEDRMTGLINNWLDANAFTILPQSELGVVGWLFVLTVLGIMILSYFDARDVREVTVPLLSPCDAENREKIAVLFRGCAQVVSSDLQSITKRMLEQLEAREDEKDKALAQLARDTVYFSCICAHHAVLRALKDQAQGVPQIQRRLEDFVLAYHKLGRWMVNLLVACDLEADAGHEAWQERHWKFQDELRRLLALDDFSKSRERLGANW